MSSGLDNASQPSNNPAGQGVSSGSHSAQPTPGTQDPRVGSRGGAGAPDSGEGLRRPTAAREMSTAEATADALSQVGGDRLAEENRERDRALADLRGAQVSGDILMGHKFEFELSFGQGGSRDRVRRITARGAHGTLRPDSCRRPASMAASATSRIVVLQGPRGYGKGAALVRTLRRDLRDDATMFYLDPVD